MTQMIVEGKLHTPDDLLIRSRTQGFIIIKNGSIVDERYFDGADENSSLLPGR